MRYFEGLSTKTICVDNVCNEDTLNDTLMNGVDELKRHSFHGYWTTCPLAELTDLAFQGGSVEQSQTPAKL